MDADLCRRAATIVNTPLWRHTFNLEDWEKKDAFIDDLTQFSTFEQLDPKTQKFFIDCDRSQSIATEMGFLVGAYLGKDELNAIIEKLYAS
jgi:hypothetical protein